MNNQEIKMPVLIEDLGMMFPREDSKQKARYGIYKCFCENEFKGNTVDTKRGRLQSCGCLNIAHGLSSHRLYHAWCGMKGRCKNKNNKDFKNYGARGIKVCDRWLDIKNFIDDMYPTFEEGLSIDRINNNGNYEPNNCRWSDGHTQQYNSRMIYNNNTSGYRGVTYLKKDKKFITRIGIDSKRITIGRSLTALEAAMAYDKYVIDNNLEHTINGVLL